MKTLALSVWFLIGGVILMLPLSAILVATGHVGWVFLLGPAAVILIRWFWKHAVAAHQASPQGPEVQ